MKNISKERTLTTVELKSLKELIYSRVKNWIKIKLRLNALITEIIDTYCKQVGMPVEDVKEALLECLEKSFNETLEQAKEKLEDLK
ncbi:MAG: hypothetical protein ISS88_02030 [Candidatus Portnoybacteria bacterium]|nr:hypothetical protein [Candidatus Portnoybacteria bacterium]